MIHEFIKVIDPSIPYTFAPTLPVDITVPTQKGNNPMYEKYDYPTARINTAAVAGSGVVINSGPETNQFTVQEEQRKYIARLALDTLDIKRDAIAMKYKIGKNWEMNNLRPKTVQDANDRLKKGLFTMKGADKKDPVKYPWYGLQEVFSWRGPDDQEDLKGYEAAMEDFNSFSGPLLTEIRIFDPKDGLESFKKIEAYEV